MDDIRQMFAYRHYFDAAKCYLLYPGEDNISNGSFGGKSYFNSTLGEKSCGVVVSNAWEITKS